MNFTLGLIIAAGALVAASLFFIALDPGYLSEPPVKPVTCDRNSESACGVDGITYDNSCRLTAAKVELNHLGVCLAEDIPLVVPVETLADAPAANVSPEEPLSPKSPIENTSIAPQVLLVSIPIGTSSLGCESTQECYIPYSASIRVGDSVMWTNNDRGAHTVSSGKDATHDGIFDSDMMTPAETFSFTFDTAGTIDYFCMLHPWMTGEIIVNEINDVQFNHPPLPVAPIIVQPSVSPVISISKVSIPIGTSLPDCETTSECFLPYHIEIKSGETISWTNVDVSAHTVTSGLPGEPDGIFESNMLMPNKTWDFVFTNSGNYDYFCMIHPWMTGKVSVV